MLLLVLSLSVALQTAGAPVDRTQFPYSRSIEHGGAGLATVRLDETVLVKSRSDLGDLRIVDSSDRQVPYRVEKREEP